MQGILNMKSNKIIFSAIMLNNTPNIKRNYVDK